MMQPSILKVRHLLLRHFRLLELLGLAMMFLAGSLEILAIRDIDRQRNYFEQHVAAQVLLDETTYRAYQVKELIYLMQPPSSPRVKDIFAGRNDAVDRLRELGDHSFGMYDMLYVRASGLADSVASFRNAMGLPQSEELARTKEDLKGLRSATESLRKGLEAQKNSNTLEFPITHFMESEFLTEKAREDTHKLARQAIREADDQKSERTRIYLVLFLLGSIALLIGKLGNWLSDISKYGA